MDQLTTNVQLYRELSFTNDLIKLWPYLTELKSHMQWVADNPHLKIGILIGADCTKAIQPLQIIPSQGDGPYALKTNLDGQLLDLFSTIQRFPTSPCIV